MTCSVNISGKLVFFTKEMEQWMYNEETVKRKKRENGGSNVIFHQVKK